MSILTTMFNATNNPPKLNTTSLAANVLRFAPNGTAPLFALTGAMGSKTAKAVEHGYFSKTMEFSKVTLAAAASAADTTLTLNTLAGTGVVEGQVLHCFATGENLRVATVPSSTTITVTRAFGRVAAAAIPNTTELFVVGTAHAEGAGRPTPRSIQAVYVSNFTQIWRNSWALTDTARATMAEAGWSNIAESQKDCGYFHAAEMEASMFFGQKHMSVGSNGQPLHATQGIIDTVRELAPSNVEDFAGAAVTYDDLIDVLALAFTQSADISNPNLRIAYCDSAAMRALQVMGREYGVLNMVMREDTFGQSFQEITFYKGKILFKEHPLFQELGINSGLVVVVDVPAINIAYLDGRKQRPENFKAGEKSYGGGMATGSTSVDGIDAQGGSILSEGAIEVLNPMGCLVINGFSLGGGGGGGGGGVP